MKKCFTINPMRSTDDFKSYHRLFKEDIFQAIEIFYPYALDEEKRALYSRNVHDIKDKFLNIEIVMHLPHGPKNDLCDIDHQEEVIKRMKAGIIYSSQFNINLLTLHLGYVKKMNSREDCLAHIILVLEDLCEFARSYNMEIMIENMPTEAEIGYSPLEILWIIKNVKAKNLKFILDCGHANLSEYTNTDYIFILKDYLSHLHISDNNGVRDEHIQVGLGNIDFDLIFNALSTINYQGLICLEILFKDASDLINYAQDIQKYDIII